ncbi:MAG: endonuclease III [Proteobacteria bacterium]|nr:endonuclease III [Pseudomonadota bacterium]
MGTSKKTKKSLVSRDSALQVFSILNKDYPNPKTELYYEAPFQLLIAVILSAQCTDERVNSVTPHLFSKFPTAAHLAKASPKEVETIIHSCGFYKNKTKAIIQTSKSLLEQFQGTVPETMEELVSLAGVGRKTASVILNQAFDKPAIAVDTHVARVSYRLGWTQSQNPLIIERDLKLLLPESLWALVNGTLILHGRRICKARKPLCSQCRIQEFCPSAEV